MSDRWVTVLAAVLGLLGGMAGAAVGGMWRLRRSPTSPARRPTEEDYTRLRNELVDLAEVEIEAVD